MNHARRLVLVGIGGAFGGIARAIAVELLPIAAERPAWSVLALLAVNLSGSLLAGFLRGLAEREQERGAAPEGSEALLLVGFCGGFTSYSAFVAGAGLDLAWVVAATLVCCPLAALVGMRLSGGYPARPAGSTR